MTAKKLVIYDFDWSLADKDTDHHAFEKFGIDKSRYYEEPQSWVNFVNNCLLEIHKKGIVPGDFSTAFHDFPISDSMVKAIKIAKENAADLYIISDGNSFFLDLALNNYGLKEYFSDIITHKANFMKDGLIKLTPVFQEGTHDCKTKAEKVGNTCSEHMCKGLKVSELKSSGYHKTIYIGDGKNDFCAACHLEKQDLLLVRKGRTLESILDTDSSQVSAEIRYWSDASEVLARFQKEFCNP